MEVTDRVKAARVVIPRPAPSVSSAPGPNWFDVSLEVAGVRGRTSPRRATRFAVKFGETRSHILIPLDATDGSRDLVVLREF